jgi:hypothetical protein
MEVILGVNVPVPVEDQLAVFAPPPNEPAIETGAPLQLTLSGPAFTVAGLLQFTQVITVINAVSDSVQPAVLE